MVLRLLEKKRELRISIEDVKKHAFFHGVSFRSFYLRNSVLERPKVIKSRAKLEKIAFYQPKQVNYPDEKGSTQSESPTTPVEEQKPQNEETPSESSSIEFEDRLTYSDWDLNDSEVIWKGTLRLKGSFRYKKYLAVLATDPALYLYRVKEKDLHVKFPFEKYHLERRNDFKFYVKEILASEFTGNQEIYKMKRDKNEFKVEVLITLVFTNL